MQFEVLTDIGQKRMVNEDSAAVFTHPEGVLLALIADGMGGHRGGGFASATAIRLIEEKFKAVSEISELNEWKNWLQETIHFVNEYLYDYSVENEEFKGMGTTLEAVLIVGQSCLIAHIGDSRVYEIDARDVRQITKDHSYVNILLDSGEISATEAAVHPKRNWIMKAVGSEKEVDPDFHSKELADGDYILVCSDGLSNKLEPAQMGEIVLSSGSLKEKVKQLIDTANELGGEDNISVILLGPAGMEVKDS